MKTDTEKLYEIHNWLNTGGRYENGATNKEVLEHFGGGYRDAWNKLKSRKKVLFFEDGRWYRWQ